MILKIKGAEEEEGELKVIHLQQKFEMFQKKGMEVGEGRLRMNAWPWELDMSHERKGVEKVKGNLDASSSKQK